MHVLIIPKWYPGRKDPQLGDFLRKQALATAQQLKVSVLYITADPKQSADHEQELETADGAWELRCYYRSSTHPWSIWRKAANLWAYLRAARNGWMRMEQERGLPKVVQAYILARPALVALWAKWRYGIPYLISEQSSEFLDGSYAAKSRTYKALCRYICRKAVTVTAVSAWLGDALVGHGLCRTYEVVPNVVPGLDRPLPPAGKPGHLLMVADLVDKTKNVSGVLRALAVARDAEPCLMLDLIGDGPDRTHLEGLVRELGLEQVVRPHGRLPNSAVLDHVGRCFAMVINSNVETFSVVTGEALAQGRPVIATRCGGPVAFVTPTNGMLIEPQDDRALAEAMIHLTRNAAKYDPATIRSSVSDRFSPAAVGAGFAVIHQRIASAHG
jgi:glycosyltransferase involved in cell wall biosynthesis